MTDLIDLNEMSKPQLQAWVVDLLAEMFELDKANLSVDSDT